MIKVKIKQKRDIHPIIQTEITHQKNTTIFEISFDVTDKTTKEMYASALEYGPKFIEPLINICDKFPFTYRGKKLDLLKIFGKYNMHFFLSKATTHKQREYVLNEIKNKKITPERLEMFLFTLKNIARIYYAEKNNIMSLKRLFINAKFGLLNKHMINKVRYYACGTTISGFIYSFKENKIVTTKVKIDGEIRRVFIKTKIHGSFSGHNPMFIDPKTFNVYAFKTDSKGKITDFKLRISGKEINQLNLTELKLNMDAFVERAKKNINNYRKYLKEKRLNKKKTAPKRHIK